MADYPSLGESLGLADVGRYPAPRGLPEDPRILMGLMTPQQMPNLSRLPFNFDAFAAALAAMPMSQNVEDRRHMTSPLNPFTKKASP